MRFKGTMITRDNFDEKYALYGHMLYRLGFVYLGRDEYVKEAMQEAFAWLFSKKKGFKTPAMEKQELLRHMMLICEHKSKELLNNTYDKYEMCDEDACTTEISELMEVVTGLPLKYRPIVHLYLYENLSFSQISKLLYKIEPFIEKQLEKGISLMEMVMEKKLDREYYCSILNQFQPYSEIQEELYLYLTAHHRVKSYLSSPHKHILSLSAAIIIVSSSVFIHYYPQIQKAAMIKYAFMNGTICSVTLDNFINFNQTDALLTYNNGDLQIYKIVNKSLKQFEVKVLSGHIDYSGMQVPISLIYYEQDGSPRFLNLGTSYDNIDITCSPAKGNTENLLLEIEEHTEDSHFIYPLLLNINTIEATDFLSSCRPSELGRITYVATDDSLTSAIIMDEGGQLYYCDIKNSSMVKIADYETNDLTSSQFCEDGTILYSVRIPKVIGDGLVLCYYEYSIGSGSTKSCYQFDYPSTVDFTFSGDSVVVHKDTHNDFIVIDARSQDSYSVPIPTTVEQGASYERIDVSPDERYILFEYGKHDSNNTELLYIYIYDLYTKKIKVISSADYKGVTLDYMCWYNNECIALVKEDAISENSNIQDTQETESQSTASIETTLWIFNINRLH